MIELKIQNINLSQYHRIICISDIHGYYSGLLKLLDKINFSNQDALIILGDLIEKGDESLNCVRYFLNNKDKNNIYLLMGNCDTTVEDLLHENQWEKLYSYLMWRKKTIIWEMINELSLTINSFDDFKNAVPLLLKYFNKEITFLLNLPTIIDSSKITFVHAGIKNEILTENELWNCLKTDSFLYQEHSFQKYVMVGHWPVNNYHYDKPVHNPIIDQKKKIIAIDGGNGVNLGGQLNAFIITNLEKMEYFYDSVENGKKITLNESQTESMESFYALYGKNEITILKQQQNTSFVHINFFKQSCWIPNQCIYEMNYKYYTNYTNYFHNLNIGDQVYAYLETDDLIYVKKNGIGGWKRKKHSL